MNDEDEIQEVEADPERGEKGEYNGFRFANGDFGSGIDYVNGIELRDFGVQDHGKLEDEAQVTDEGLPIQQYRTGQRLFLRRHIQMMAISTPNFPTRLCSCSIGVSIGTGVFYYTGSPYYAEAGPVSLLLAFVLSGTVAYGVLVPSLLDAI